MWFNVTLLEAGEWSIEMAHLVIFIPFKIPVYNF